MVSTPSILHYQIIRRISEGGFGTTYLAEDTHIHPPAERRRIIKQLKPVHNDPQTYEIIKERFKQEAKILEDLGKGHSQVPVLYGYFEEQKNFYLIEEYIEGKTLDQVIAQQGPLSDQQVKKILGELVDVLEYLQKKRIIHRDIKPENIIIRESDGLPVLIDFGAMKQSMGTTVTTSGYTALSIVIGTPGFMPPEQMAGRPVYASDIYALGLTGVYLLTGKRPDEIESDPMTGELLWQQHAPQVSAELGKVLNQAIHSQAKDRFLMAKDLANALANPNNFSIHPSFQGGTPSNTSTVVVSSPTAKPKTGISRMMDGMNPLQKNLMIFSLIISSIGVIAGITTASINVAEKLGNKGEKPEDKTEVVTKPSPSDSEPEASPTTTTDLDAEKAKLEEEKKRLEIEKLRKENEALKRQTASSPPSTTTYPSNPSTSSSSNSNWRSFCGSPAGSGSVWYGVVGDSRALGTVKGNYCGDALIMGGYTQAASFTSYAEAQQFAQYLSSQTGYNFWVKSPRQPVYNPPSSSNSLSYRSSCGDPSGSGSTWYAVVGSSGALNVVRSRYCGDAIINGSGNTQVANFTSPSRAAAFASQLQGATGMSFWVK